MIMMRAHALLLLPAILVAACATSPSDGSTAVGSVNAAIAVVPPAVNCLRLVAGAGTHDFDVVPGRGAILTIDNLPIGSTSFAAFAFAQSCGTIGANQPTWAAPPVTATVSAGQTSALTLKLTQVGSADVTIDFGDAGVPDMSTAPDMSKVPDMAIICIPSGNNCGSIPCCSGSCVFGIFCN